MTHLRTPIFDLIVSTLSEIDAFSEEGKVKRGRTSAPRDDLLPAVNVSWADRSENTTIRPSSGPAGEDGYDRGLAVGIWVYLRDIDTEETFDALAEDIETAMGAIMTPGGAVIQIVLEGSEFFVDTQTGIPLGVGRLTYRVYYKTLINPSQPAL